MLEESQDRSVRTDSRRWFRVPYPHILWPVVTFSLLSMLGAFAAGLYLLWFFAALWGAIWFVVGFGVLLASDLFSTPIIFKSLGFGFTWRFFLFLLPLIALLAGTCAANIATLPEFCQGVDDAC